MKKDRKILLGVDLEKSIETALFREIIAHTYFEVSACVTDVDLDVLSNVGSDETVDLYLFVQRRIANDLKLKKRSLSRISEIGALLEGYGILGQLDKIVLVDVAERPSPILSDTMLLAEYMECISTNISSDAFGFVFSLDCDLSYDMNYQVRVHDIAITDTRSDEFKLAYSEYAMSSLRGLNERSESVVTLPDVPSIEPDQLDEAIQSTLKKFGCI